MIAYVLVGLAVLIGLYFYFKKSKKNVVEYMVNHQLEPFIPSPSFVGAKEGYVFKMDDVGLGYYLDN
tara:strand:+ start:1033 stop:1233 length:201 start_codon:yes stop_codon:yes gene_type:complete